MRFAATFALLLATGAASAASPAGAGLDQDQGDVLGVDRKEGTITVRIQRPDGKETRVFHVVRDTVIRDRESGRTLSLEEVEAGDRVQVRSRHRAGRREAVSVEVRPAKRRGK